jgi:hypothetical protein
MTERNDELPMADDSDVHELDIVIRLGAEVQELRQRNLELRAKAAAREQLAARRVSAGENSLTAVTAYDRTLLSTIDDIVDDLHKAGLVDNTESPAEARAFVKLFGIAAQAQLRVPGRRGVGHHLYLTPEVKCCIDVIKTSRIA